MTPSDSSRTRLCIVTPAHWSAPGGGAEYQIKYLIEALLPMDRFDIFYIARHIGAGATFQGHEVRRVGSTASTPRLGYLSDARELYRTLADISPDVIYQRVGCGYTGIAAYFARKHRRRMLWHMAHDNDALGKTVFLGRNPLRPKLENLSIRYGARHATHIVAQSAAQARLLHNTFGRDATRVIPNFHPAPREIIDKSGPTQVVWVANFKEWKRPAAFVRLATALRDLRDVRFIMVGAPYADTAEWMKSLVREIRQTPNLEYRGAATNDAVNELLAKSHVFVNTSIHEGFPNTFIQAWMRGVPVVSLSVDPDDVLAERNVGICAGSEQNLVQAVRQLVTTPELLRDYAERARSHGLTNHSVRNASLLAQLLVTGTSQSDD